MTTEFFDQPWRAACDGIEHVANVNARHRARRPFEPLLIGSCERDDRTMNAILDARSDESDDALMPAFIEQAQSERQLRIVAHLRDRQDRFLLHLQFELTSILIQLR